MKILSLLFCSNWGVFLYINGDNSLSPLVDTVLAQLKSTQVKNISATVLVDYLTDESQFYKLDKTGLHFLYRKGEIDMGDYNTLVDFVRESKSFVSADRYALVIWGHGNGWREKLQAVSKDRSSGNSIGVAGGELKKAFEEIKKIIGKKISIVIFDACVMGIMEVACEIKDAVEVMIASESLFVSSGIPYDILLNAMDRHASLSTEEVATYIVDEVSSYYKSKGITQYISAICLLQLNSFISRFNTLLEKDNISILKDARKESKEFSIESGYPDYVDMLSFLKNIKDEEAMESINKVIIYAYPVGGIGIWFPLNYLSFKYAYKEYKKLLWDTLCKWTQFLYRFYGIDDVPPRIDTSFMVRIKDNLVELQWRPADDFALKGYRVVEAVGKGRFLTPVIDENNFVLNKAEIREGKLRFGADCSALLKQKISKSFFLEFEYNSFLSESYDVETMMLEKDGFYIEVSKDGVEWERIDSITFKSFSWQKRNLIFQTDQPVYLKFEFIKKIPYEGGLEIRNVFIDTLSINSIFYEIENKKILFGKKRGKYYYFVCAEDSVGNRSNYIYKTVYIKNYTSPYTMPSPFRNKAKLILDYPGDKADVFIYSITGKLLYVKNIENGEKEIEIPTNCLKEGLYIVIVITPTIKIKGKIMKIE